MIVTADHGECLDDHVCWFDHHGLYEENVHVPLLMRLPGRIPAGRRAEGFATLTDIAPTVLEALGSGDVAGQEGMEGLSLWGQLTGTRARRVARDQLYLTECTWMRKRAWRTREWKLIEALEPDLHDLPPIELYNLSETRGSKRTWPGATRTWCSRCSSACGATPHGACGRRGSPIRCRHKRSPCARSASSRRRCRTINGCADSASQRGGLGLPPPDRNRSPRGSA